VDLITDGINGLLVEPVDAARLADVILRVVKELGLARSLGGRRPAYRRGRLFGLKRSLTVT